MQAVCNVNKRNGKTEHIGRQIDRDEIRRIAFLAIHIFFISFLDGVHHIHAGLILCIAFGWRMVNDDGVCVCVWVTLCVCVCV